MRLRRLALAALIALSACGESAELPFNAGVRNLHESMQQLFSTPLEALPVKGRVLRYRPPLGALSAGMSRIGSRPSQSRAASAIICTNG